MRGNVWYVPWEDESARYVVETSQPQTPPCTTLQCIGSNPSAEPSPDIKDEEHQQLAKTKSSAKRRTPKQLAKDRDALIRLFATSTTRQEQWISWLRSASIERLTFQATFIDLFFDKAGTRFRGFEIILSSADRAPALITALDAICLVHVGTTHKDQRLLEAARVTYGSALAKVRRKILAPQQDASLLVAAVYLLTICEFFSATAAPDQGWRRHIRGILQLLGALDLAALDPSIRVLVGTLLRGPAVWHAILERKSLPSLDKIQHAIDDGTTFSSSTSFIKLAVRVPGTIEQVDLLRYAKPRPSVATLSKCCREIVSLCNELRSWMGSWSDTLSEEPFTIAPIAILADHKGAVTTSETAFPFAYRFSNPLLAPKHRTYWTCMLSLTQAHLDLFEAFPELLHELQSHDQEMEMLITIATELADHLCMTIAFDTQPENGYVALFSAMVPLELAAAWYKRRNDTVKLGWCRRAMRIFEAAGLQTSKL
ncbi:hypothetical protein CKM354_000575800 [Cercospora kikuchii]|uniref:Uncharacterized protein n=1 Tax=Cercospora kikuchii TaxID=84275 RepID=A0A9P3CFX2_9PEZI|nr:uncharacterized protein CKM354_000575800 [Cercospora kikuchii]GIZ42492.1 hypothetical protein CKM354_000575800 [Cercospora kikuchii]